MSVPSIHVHQRETVAAPSVAEAVDALVQTERAKWAMKIHDGLTQSVTSAILELQSLRKRIETEPKQAMADLKTIEDEIRKDLREIRGVLFALQEDQALDPNLEASSLAGLSPKYS